MNFQTLSKVESAQTYLDIAFSSSQKAVMNYKHSSKSKSGKKDREGNKIGHSRFDVRKNAELFRMVIVRDSLTNMFDNIIRGFPSLEDLPPFYNELVKATLDYYALKKSLGTVDWGRKKINTFYNLFVVKIKTCREFPTINQYRSEFFGRISSVVYQMEEALKYLEYARRTMKEFPSVKTETKTVVVSGFPNVGKTTLLYKLTGSMPEISNYAFTTKGINVSYFVLNDSGKIGKIEQNENVSDANKENGRGRSTKGSKKGRIQVLDTPGTLNRFNKMNGIEKQAYLAMKHCGDVFIYVFDLTEPYPLKDQEKLYDVVHEFGKKIIIYISKTDILPPEKVKEFMKKHKNAICDIDELKKKVEYELRGVKEEEDNSEEENN